MRTARQLIKKSSLTVGVALTILLSPNSYGFIWPIVDRNNILENIATQTQDLENRLKDEAGAIAKRELKKELKKSVGLSSANQQATKLTAEQRLEKSLRDHEVASQNTPTPGLCNTRYYVDENGEMQSQGFNKDSILTFSMRGELFCNIISQHKSDEYEEIAGLAIPSGDVNDTDIEVAINEEDRLVDEIFKEEDENGQLSVDDIIPHKLTGLSKEEYDHALDKLKIMLPPMEDSVRVNYITNDGYVKNISKSMRSMLPYQTQVDQITDKLRPAQDMYSERESQDMFAADFMNTENIESYSFKNMMLVSQVEREKAMMTAYLVHIAIQKYKSALDRELLLSVRLVENIPD
jgi:hypothetical protein